MWCYPSFCILTASSTANLLGRKWHFITGLICVFLITRKIAYLFMFCSCRSCFSSCEFSPSIICSLFHFLKADLWSPKNSFLTYKSSFDFFFFVLLICSPIYEWTLPFSHLWINIAITSLCNILCLSFSLTRLWIQVKAGTDFFHFHFLIFSA